MKTPKQCLPWLTLLAAVTAAPLLGRDDGSCTAEHNHGWWNDSKGFAEARQEQLPNASLNQIDPGQNGSVRVHGWDKSNVLVKACVQTSAPTEDEARQLASQIKITQGAGHIEAKGPHPGGRRGWSVSYEIWMPEQAETKIEAYNGSVSVEQIRGGVRFHTLNGSVKLTDVGGDVAGETTNGSVLVRVAEGSKYRNGLRVATTNGSVRLELPDGFGAQVEASTVNGSIRTGFPITVSGEIGRHLSFTLGDGAAAIEARTTNGSIHIERRA